MGANKAVTGGGFAVVLVWAWNSFLAGPTGADMPGEVAAALAPLVIALLDRCTKDW